MGKPVIMGRKTWDSLPRKPLPGRHNIVITRQKGFVAEGATVVADGEAALRAAGDVEEVAIIGGGEINRMFLPLAGRIYLTEVALDVEGDTLFPMLDARQWREVGREDHAQGPRDTASFTLRILDRIGNG